MERRQKATKDLSAKKTRSVRGERANASHRWDRLGERSQCSTTDVETLQQRNHVYGVGVWVWVWYRVQ